MANAQTVVSVYRPKPGCREPLLDLVRRHVPRLAELGLAGSAPVVLLQSSKDGSLLEIFDWRDAAAVEEAHESPAVMSLWKAFGELAECVPLASLEEAGAPFAHFERVPL